MKKHQKIIATTSVLIGLSLIGYSFWQSKAEEPTPKKEEANGAEVTYQDHTKEKEVPTESEKLVASIIGAHDLSENSYTKYETIDWKETPSKEHRFVLVSNKESITKDKTEILQKWIGEKKVVVFYGTDVKPEEVKKKLGLEGDVINVETTANVAFPYLLYGFGYSDVHQKNIPIFMGSNTDQNLAEKIGSFLYKNESY